MGSITEACKKQTNDDDITLLKNRTMPTMKMTQSNLHSQHHAQSYMSYISASAF